VSAKHREVDPMVAPADDWPFEFRWWRESQWRRAARVVGDL